MGDREDAARGAYTALADDHGTVVQRGVLKKMFSIRRWLMLESMVSPVATISSRETPRSMTMSAPTFWRAMFMHAMTIGIMVLMSGVSDACLLTNSFMKAPKRWCAPRE